MKSLFEMGARGQVLVAVLVLAAAVAPYRGQLRRWLEPVVHRLRGRATVADRLEQVGTAARGRLRPHFERAGCPYPPKELTLVGLKAERRLEVWAKGEASEAFRWVCEYPILGRSGGPGPKLREGDRQIPEGLYRIESLNPNSRYHLSLRINYPNEFDRRHAQAEGRASPGGDIMIHGGSGSVGCLAMGDPVAEELFVLCADVGLDPIRVVLSPVDFRAREMPALDRPLPGWCDDLYAQVRQELARLVHPTQKEGMPP